MSRPSPEPLHQPHSGFNGMLVQSGKENTSENTNTRSQKHYKKKTKMKT
jgi:hypothetical protein